MANYLNGDNRTEMSDERWTARFIDRPKKSSITAIGGATGSVATVNVPSGAIVTQVGLYAIATLYGTFSVGDEDSSTQFTRNINGLNKGRLAIIGAGVGTGTTVPTDQQSMVYGTNKDIAIQVAATATAASAQLLVWYDLYE